MLYVRLDQYRSRLAGVVAVARTIVTYDVSLPLGVKRMQQKLFCLRPLRQLHYPIFSQYEDAVQDFVVGSNRLYWNREALFELDKRFDEVDRAFRAPIHATCWEIIDRCAVSK